MVDTRVEMDLLGEREIPNDAYWGIHTLRALENFPITGRPISTNAHLVRGLAAVKWAAASANEELGILDATRSEAIRRACQEILDGRWHEQFVVDVVQGGAGTSTNMNANEVIANRALEILGYEHGEYSHLHPNEHVNASQSTNDVYPTAVNIATIYAAHELIESMKILRDAFRRKAREFATVVKMGRTQLQDAVPMTLGQEFGTYAIMIDEDCCRLDEAALLVHEINLGATAIGTGLNAPVGYTASAVEHLRRKTGLPLVSATDLIEATQDVGQFVHLSGVLKRVAVKLSKICNDLRLLSSGPRAGLNEINLPAVQAGSSIMPGKVNPVIPEAVTQVAAQVIGNDAAVTVGGLSGAFELNVYIPMMARNVLESFTLLSNVSKLFAAKCIDGLVANDQRLRELAESSPSIVTPLNSAIGYEEAAKVAKEALKDRKTIRQAVIDRGLIGDKLSEEELDKRLDVLAMAKVKDDRR